MHVDCAGGKIALLVSELLAVHLQNQPYALIFKNCWTCAAWKEVFEVTVVHHGLLLVPRTKKIHFGGALPDKSAIRLNITP